MIRVRNLADKDLTFLSDSQETQAIKDHLGGTLVQEYDSFFVKIVKGDYSEVWGMYGIIPFEAKYAYRLI